MDRLMTRREAADFLGFAPQTLARYAWLGKGPKFTKCGRSVRYTKSSLEAWVAAIADNDGHLPAPKTKPRRVVSIGPRVVIDGHAYYPEKKVAEAMHRLGAVWISWDAPPSG